MNTPFHYLFRILGELRLLFWPFFFRLKRLGSLVVVHNCRVKLSPVEIMSLYKVMVLWSKQTFILSFN